MSTGIETIDLGTDDPNVVAIKITGEFTGEAMQEFIARIEEIRAAGNKALVYIDLLGYEGQELAVAKNKLANISTLWTGIERMAYVVEAAWMMKAMKLIDAVTPMHFRAFGADEDAAARAWVVSGE